LPAVPLPRRSLLAACWLLLATAAAAQGQAALLDLQISRADDGLRLSYSSKLELPKPADEALHKGVPLYFVAEVQLQRARWYWRDALVARSSRTWRITHQPLTRQYRLSTGGLHQGFETLAEALATIGRASGWTLALREDLQPDARYELTFRLRLDVSQLPGPLQIGLGPGALLDLQQVRSVPGGELLGPAKE
jgi:Domain of unknown function (DUF4390)